MNDCPSRCHLGDCLEVLATLPDESVDAIVTDPPYGLSFMGKRWDYDVPGSDIWAECLRVLKPGGYLLAFAGTRTQHRMAVRIEDAGFEIRDMIAWVYGSGFPKSLDVSKAIDKEAGIERTEVVSRYRARDFGLCSNNRLGSQDVEVAQKTVMQFAPATQSARQWQGWGTALKPAIEPITVARKPFRGTVADNVLAHGTGALNIDACRVASGSDHAERCASVVGLCSNRNGAVYGEWSRARTDSHHDSGRWPANLIHDGSPEVVCIFPDDKVFGSTARFFYCAKASRRDRNDGLPCGEASAVSTNSTMRECEGADWPARNGNHHPTVKPTDLMAYLCRLVTPPGGVVLDPFMGSGSTGKAAVREGYRFIGIEREAEYVAIAEARIEAELAKSHAKRSSISQTQSADERLKQFDLFAEGGA